MMSWALMVLFGGRVKVVKELYVDERAILCLFFFFFFPAEAGVARKSKRMTKEPHRSIQVMHWKTRVSLIGARTPNRTIAQNGYIPPKSPLARGVLLIYDITAL